VDPSGADNQALSKAVRRSYTETVNLSLEHPLVQFSVF
jgi:hypothetical protein